MQVENSSRASHPKGRKQTDKCLKAERAKADDSLSEGKSQAEQRADDAVSANRANADQTRSRDRVNFDSIAGEDTAATPNGAAGRLLQLERTAADAALANERRHVDSVLGFERDQNRAAERDFLQRDRRESDKNLTSERDQFDLDVQSAATRLAEEKDAHQTTKAALTTRDEFLAIVSHDLRNPLGAISMVAEALTESPSYAAFDDETRQHIEMIGRNAAEALRLIGDLLDMERIAAGKLGLRLAVHDVGPIAEHALATFKLQASAKKLTLQLIKDDAAALVTCDRGRLSQVLSNLLGNAIKFTPIGGDITLALRCEGGEVLISCADSGPGIPAAMRSTIFERFWQLGKRDRRGLGLGLYISKMLVEAQLGRIWVESHLGLGSTFHVALPAVALNAPA